MYHWSNPEITTTTASSSSAAFPTQNYNERTKVLLADLDTPGSYIVVAKGGRGGTGNSTYASRQYKPNQLSTITQNAMGTPGESSHLELELKLVADVGLVGFPNAGKSSLLSALSRARPEIAPYPFTTLHPVVGCVEYKDGTRVLAADVPGLVEGASRGRGRGVDFLRHLERTRALLYLVDAAGVDGRDAVEDLRVLCQEVASYDTYVADGGGGGMMDRPALVVANKMDLIADQTKREELLWELGAAAQQAGIRFWGKNVFGISAGVTGEGLRPLSKALRDIVALEEANRIVSSTDDDS